MPAVALLSDQSVYYTYEGVLYKHDVEIVHYDAKTVLIRGLSSTDGNAVTMVVMESLLNAEEGMAVETRDENGNLL